MRWGSITIVVVALGCGSGDDGAGSGGSDGSSGAPGTMTTQGMSGGDPSTASATSMATGGSSSTVDGSGSGGGSETGDPPEVDIIDVAFDDATHVQLAPGSDNWACTWADDGNVYTTWGDGGGFGGTNSVARVSLGYARVEGDFDAYQGFNVWGDTNEGVPPAENAWTHEGKSYSLVSVGGVLYSWVGVQPGNQFALTRLYRSDDLAATWQNTGQEIDTGDFGGAFSHPNILNFGQDYAGARDGFVYTYWSGEKPQSAQSADQAYLTRVPVASIDDLGTYEYFAGLAGPDATWSTDPGDRVAAYENTGAIHWAFNVVHIAGLDKYVLINNASPVGGGGFPDAGFQSDIEWLQADAPWGPFTPITTLTDWRPPTSSDNDRYTFFFDVPTKWQSADGLDFTLMFTGVSGFDSWNTIRGSFTVQ